MTHATHSHRVFEALQGLYPVTFANVIEADPQGLRDIFEGSDSTRDAYFDMLNYLLAGDWDTSNSLGPYEAADGWANWLKNRWSHAVDCVRDDLDACECQQRHYSINQVWGRDLYQDIQQRIEDLNG